MRRLPAGRSLALSHPAKAASCPALSELAIHARSLCSGARLPAAASRTWVWLDRLGGRSRARGKEGRGR